MASMSSWRAEGKPKNKCKGSPVQLKAKRKALKKMAALLKEK